LQPLASQASTSAQAVALQQQKQSQTSPSGQQHVEEHFWEWRWRSKIRYFKAGSGGPPLLLIHGFGVGAWHFEKNIQELASKYTVYAIDLLGQGSSWPAQEFVEELRTRARAAAAASAGAPAGAGTVAQGVAPGMGAGVGATGSAASMDMEPEGEGALCYSIDTWTRQMAEFVRDVIRAPAYVAGNSLGGYVATNLAATYGGSVRGLVLINSTPFWSFKPPASRPQGVWGLLGLDGTVPVPQGLRRTIEVLWWDRLRSRDTVASMLGLVYAHKPAVEGDAALVSRIIEATEQPGALDAFASIVLAPRSELEFDEMLARAGCPVALVYGRQDPWVVPMWGQRAVHTLNAAGAPPVMYLELDGAGHCPHHEAPRATNTAIATCLDHMEAVAGWAAASRQSLDGAEVPPRPQPPLPVGGRWEVAEDDGSRVVVVEHVAGGPRILPEMLAHAVWKVQAAVKKVTGQQAPGTSSQGNTA